MDVNFQYDLTPDEAREMAFAELCRGNMTRAQEYERMALKAIPTNQIASIDAGNVKPLVIMLDEPEHTPENGYRCTDETCPCQNDSPVLNAPLHSNRGFTLLK